MHDYDESLLFYLHNHTETQSSTQVDDTIEITKLLYFYPFREFALGSDGEKE